VQRTNCLNGSRRPRRESDDGADDGLEPTLDDLAWLMVIVSDNTATAMLVEVLGGPAEINTTTAALGCPTARMNESITLERALARESFAEASPRTLAELDAHLGSRVRYASFGPLHSQVARHQQRSAHRGTDVFTRQRVVRGSQFRVVANGLSNERAARGVCGTTRGDRGAEYPVWHLDEHDRVSALGSEPPTLDTDVVLVD
jgi:hypothetical protein